METKQIKIEVPQGYEIDKEKSTFENIILKPIEKKLPLSVEEIPNRPYYISSHGIVTIYVSEPTKNHLSTENRAKAFLALMQLVELRDAWNGEWRADWDNNFRKYIIEVINDKITLGMYFTSQKVLHFKTEELAEKFATQFEDLINEAKELL
jgi:hypothetical protein